MFGEMPSFTFNGATAQITLPENGVTTIMLVADTVFADITFRWPVASPASVPITGLTIPAGTTLYGVSTYQVTTGAGVAYNSTF